MFSFPPSLSLPNAPSPTPSFFPPSLPLPLLLSSLPPLSFSLPSLSYFLTLPLSF